MFHKLVALFISTFSLQWILIYPMMNFKVEGNYPLNRIQGQFCTKTAFNQFLEEDQKKELKVKPKLIVMTSMLLIIISVIFFTTSAHKQKRKRQIPKTRQNLMTMKHQLCHLVIFCLSVVFVQIQDLVMTLFYEEIGVDNVFKIWWTFQLLWLLILQVILPICTYANAINRFKEFRGLIGKQFPGQETPRPLEIRPRYDNIEKMPDKKTVSSTDIFRITVKFYGEEDLVEILTPIME